MISSIAAKVMNKHNYTDYFIALHKSGWTLRECIHGKGSDKPVQVQPDWFDSTYEIYQATIKSYIFNMKFHLKEDVK